MIVIGKNTNIETQNNKKDSQQDTRIDSLQTAVDSLNAQVSAISASITAINASIDDKYSAQKQTLMSALSSQIEALSSSLASVVSTAQVNANIGNFERLAATISATITSLSAKIATITEKATVEEAEVNTLDVNTANVGTLGAIVANLETVNAELLNVTSFVVTTLTVENLNVENVNAGNIDADIVDSDKVITDVITGKEWHTPISTPDNTELLHISIPKYNGVIQILTQDNEFNISILNNYFVAFNQSGDYIYRIARGETSTDIYLMNVGDTVNYSILWFGDETHGTATSEIVDRTAYHQNIMAREGILDIEYVITNIEIVFADYLPSEGEANKLYCIKTQGAYIWNEERSEFYSLMGTDWQEWIESLEERKYDKTGGTISGDVTVEGETTLNDDVYAEKNLKVKGDLIVEGQTLTTEEQTLATDSNYAVLRKNNPSGLASGEKSGVVIHNYQTGKNASLAISNDGEFRVSDNVAETTTTYINLAKFGNTYYSGLDSSTVATVVEGAAVSENVDVVADCVLETTSGKWYHSLNAEWFEMSLVDNALSFDKDSPVTDETLIATLEALTKQNLFYFRSLSILVISDSTDQPLLTREEAEDLQNNDILVWDETNRKATNVSRPSSSGQVLTSTVYNGEVSYQWETGAGDKADLTDLAATFSTSTTYAVGDYVTYNKDLYKCTTAHSGAWDSSHFTAVTVGDMLRLLANTLDTKVDKVSGKGLSTNDFTTALLNKLNGIESGAQVNTVTGVKGNSESSYRTGNVNITKSNIGLGNVDNTADANKSVNYATSAGKATTLAIATCSTASGTAAKVANLANFALVTGCKISIIFSNANSAASPTLNVNNTGAKSIKIGSGASSTTPAAPSATSTAWNGIIANTVYEAFYDGSVWILSRADGPSLGVKACYFSTSGGYIKYSNGLLIQFFKRSYIPLNTLITFPLDFSTVCMGVWFSQVGDSFGAMYNCSLYTEGGHTTDYLTKTGFYGRSVYCNVRGFGQTNNDVYILAIGY